MSRLERLQLQLGVVQPCTPPTTAQIQRTLTMVGHGFKVEACTYMAHSYGLTSGLPIRPAYAPAPMPCRGCTWLVGLHDVHVWYFLLRLIAVKVSFYLEASSRRSRTESAPDRETIGPCERAHLPSPITHASLVQKCRCFASNSLLYHLQGHCIILALILQSITGCGYKTGRAVNIRTVDPFLARP